MGGELPAQGLLQPGLLGGHRLQLVSGLLEGLLVALKPLLRRLKPCPMLAVRLLQAAEQAGLVRLLALEAPQALLVGPQALVHRRQTLLLQAVQAARLGLQRLLQLRQLLGLAALAFLQGRSLRLALGLQALAELFQLNGLLAEILAQLVQQRPLLLQALGKGLKLFSLAGAGSLQFLYRLLLAGQALLKGAQRLLLALHLLLQAVQGGAEARRAEIRLAGDLLEALLQLSHRIPQVLGHLSLVPKARGGGAFQLVQALLQACGALLELAQLGFLGLAGPLEGIQHLGELAVHPGQLLALRLQLRGLLGALVLPAGQLLPELAGKAAHQGQLLRRHPSLARFLQKARHHRGQGEAVHGARPVKAVPLQGQVPPLHQAGHGLVGPVVGRHVGDGRPRPASAGRAFLGPHQAARRQAAGCGHHRQGCQHGQGCLRHPFPLSCHKARHGPRPLILSGRPSPGPSTRWPRPP